MKMQALVALKNFSYASRQIAAGETFEASPRDARILVAIRKAQIDPAGHAAAEPAAAIEERSEREVVREAISDAPVKRARRTYARRAQSTEN